MYFDVFIKSTQNYDIKYRKSFYTSHELWIIRYLMLITI